MNFEHLQQNWKKERLSKHRTKGIIDGALDLHDHAVGSFADVGEIRIARSYVELLATNDLDCVLERSSHSQLVELNDDTYGLFQTERPKRASFT